ncbi:MAG: P-II family nitrogen regulator [Deltaproteobacteria bacterium]|nr:P-II family nitrogen regulator [Deltaproteobacteria bacterium]
MKKIESYIKPHKLSEVTLALHKVEGLTGMSVTHVHGFGRPKPKGVTDRYRDQLDEYGSYEKIEIVCSDELAEEIVSTIQKAAHTGLRGDGKIYVSSIEKSVRISTGDCIEGCTQ